MTPPPKQSWYVTAELQSIPNTLQTSQKVIGALGLLGTEFPQGYFICL